MRKRGYKNIQGSEIEKYKEARCKDREKWEVREKEKSERERGK